MGNYHADIIASQINDQILKKFQFDVKILNGNTLIYCPNQNNQIETKILSEILSEIVSEVFKKKFGDLGIKKTYFGIWTNKGYATITIFPEAIFVTVEIISYNRQITCSIYFFKAFAPALISAISAVMLACLALL